MSSFFGSEIIFNGIPSSTYGLRIINFESGVSDGPAGSDASLVQKYIYRKPKPYYFGRNMNTPLEMDITLGAENVIEGSLRGLIESWLLGRTEYLPLQILQEDISNVIFDCMFTKATNKYIGNVQRAITVHAVCQGPWGYTYPQSLIKNYDGGGITNETFDFYNLSDDPDYMYPTIEFSTNGVGTSFYLLNMTENRPFFFSGISANEQIIVDNYRQTIQSYSALTHAATGLLRVGNFNKKFFRLLPGINTLNIVGGISNFTMTYNFAKKIGG